MHVLTGGYAVVSHTAPSFLPFLADGFPFTIQHSRPSLRNGSASKSRKIVPDRGNLDGSDSSSSSASGPDSGSEDEGCLSDDDLAREAPRMSEKDFTDLYQTEASPLS